MYTELQIDATLHVVDLGSALHTLLDGPDIQCPRYMDHRNLAISLVSAYEGQTYSTNWSLA